jgi:hypothetical protein
MQNISAVSTWLARKLATSEDGIGPAYVSVCPQEGRKSYPQRARINVGDKPTPQVIEDVIAALADIDESRRAEDNPLARVKLHVYGPKGLDSLGEMVFHVGTELDASARADGDGTREGELVATIRELRLIVGESVQALGKASSSGYTLALESLRENARLSHELADTRAALMLAEQQQGGGTMDRMIEGILPVVATRMLATPPTTSTP